MSSAAAAAANIGVPPEGQNGTLEIGEVTSLVQSPDSPIPNKIDPPEQLDEDDESDIGVKASKRKERRRILEEDDNDGHLENGEDLFGDEDDKNELESTKRKPRQLDDEELDSGDDMGRDDRVHSDAEAEVDGDAEVETAQIVVEEPSFVRRPLPQPSDGEMYLLKIPKFMAIEPQMFHTPSFQVPTTEHHSRKEPSATFSAFNTAMSTLRWRHSPSKPEELQSNARILRWSDGSLTLQFGSDPTQQYEIDGKPLAPPQKRPAKPTPVSINRTGPGAGRESKVADTYSYLSVPEANVGLLRVVNKITAGLSILPSASTKDDAEERLRASLTAAAQERSGGMSHGITLMKTNVDPETARMEAEALEKQKTRQQKNLERAAERMNNGPGRGKGGRTSMGGGLSASMLEDDDTGSGRPKAKAKSRRRTYNDEYSEDEDFGHKKANFASEEYEKDDFVADDDDEEESLQEEEAEESDPDEGLGDISGKPKTTDADSPKRSRAETADADDAGDQDDDEAIQARKRKVRRVVDEDDEDE